MCEVRAGEQEAGKDLVIQQMGKQGKGEWLLSHDRKDRREETGILNEC